MIHLSGVFPSTPMARDPGQLSNPRKLLDIETLVKRQPDVQFKGKAPGLMGALEFIDGNAIAQLTVIDLFGMVIPRTWIEAAKRGNDAAREMGVREISGTVLNLFAVGWLGWLGMQSYNHSVRLNPLGISMNAWINANSLEAFGRLYANSMDKVLQGTGPKTGHSVREHFVESVLNHLVSSDTHMPQTLGSLALEQIDDASLREKLSAVYLQDPRQGRLSKEGVQEILARYRLGNKPSQSIQNLAETIETQVEQAVREQGANLTGEKLEAFKLRQRAKAWLKTGNAHVRKQERKAFLKTLEEILSQENRLTSTVTLDHPQAMVEKKSLLQRLGLGKVPEAKPLLQEQSRDRILKELRNFLEYYADRAWVEEVGSFGKELTETKAEGILSRLGITKTTENVLHFARTLLPDAKKGLIPNALGTKFRLVGISLFISIVGSFSVAFINNWFTKKLHGGDVFFPGERGAREKMLGLSPSEASGMSAKAQPSGSGLGNPLPASASSLGSMGRSQEAQASYVPPFYVSAGSPKNQPLVDPSQRLALGSSPFAQFRVMTSPLRGQHTEGGALQ